MPDGIILSQETYDRLMEMLHDYDEGLLNVIPGTGLIYEEIGPDGTKLGVDGTECP